MNPLLPDIPIFVEVARQKSFSKAAEALELGVSTVSRRIRLLEKTLGGPLFLRDTHSVKITNTGELLLEHCKFILSAAEGAMESLSRNVRQPSGRVRISMYADVYHGLLRGTLSAFLDEWPDIHLSVHFAEDPPDLLSDPYDVMLCIGPLPDSSLAVRKLLTVFPAVYASPKLLEKAPAPDKPQDLCAMPCIVLSRFGSTWELRQGNEVAIVHISPRFALSSVMLVQEFILGGHGVGLLREELAAPYEKTGKLVRLLPQWTGPVHDMYIVVKDGQIPRRVQVFVDYMVKHFASMPR